jgi:surfactin synthase thioesterase subunit
VSETSTLQPWIFCPRPNPAARLRLFCLPYAGRGASIYRAWPELLGDKVEMSALQLPGRENRLREAPFTRLLDSVEQLVNVLRPYLNLPFALFGHSMGAVICFELARVLRRERQIVPAHLFVSGRRAPQFPDPRPPMTSLSDELFAAEICRRYNGIPHEVLKDRELMELLLPTLRADVEMLETYDYRPGQLFDCPITAFGGRNDSETSLDELAGWKHQTNAPFESHIFAGDHFFLQSSTAEMIEIIRQKLDSAFPGAA